MIYCPLHVYQRCQRLGLKIEEFEIYEDASAPPLSYFHGRGYINLPVVPAFLLLPFVLSIWLLSNLLVLRVLHCDLVIPIGNKQISLVTKLWKCSALGTIAKLWLILAVSKQFYSSPGLFKELCIFRQYRLKKCCFIWIRKYNLLLKSSFLKLNHV